MQDNQDPKDGVDVTDLQAVAGALTEESMQALRAMLTAKGIPIEALDVVLKDILEGRETEGVLEDESEDENEQQQERETKPLTAEQASESVLGQRTRKPEDNNVAENGCGVEPIVDVQDEVLTESDPVMSRKKRRRRV